VEGEVRLRSAEIGGESVDVDAGFTVEFAHPNERVERWKTGMVYEQITVTRSGGPLSEQLDVMARSAVEDVIADMHEADLETHTDIESVPVTWKFDDRLARLFA